MYCEFAMFVQTFHEIAMMFAYIYIHRQPRTGRGVQLRAGTVVCPYRQWTLVVDVCWCDLMSNFKHNEGSCIWVNDF